MEANQDGPSQGALDTTDNQGTAEESAEPPAKKLCGKRSNASEDAKDVACTSTYDLTSRLEQRLSTVFCCTVCLDLPVKAIYQCPNGHLMCAGCFNHLLADGRLKNEMSTCPNCRIEITESSCTRNLAVEKAVSELPMACKFCKCEVPRFHVEKHEMDLCLDRLVSCKFTKIGCHWQGIFKKRLDHEERCAQARKTGQEIMESLDKMSKEEETKLSLYKSLLSLLSYERIIVHDLQLRPRRTEDFIPELFYDTNRFSTFGQDWIIRAQVVGNEKSLRRGFTFQLVQTTICSMYVKYIFVKSPYAELEMYPVIFQHDFSNESPESHEQDLPIPQDIDINKLLAAKVIPVRLVMFLGKT